MKRLYNDQISLGIVGLLERMDVVESSIGLTTTEGSSLTSKLQTLRDEFDAHVLGYQDYVVLNDQAWIDNNLRIGVVETNLVDRTSRIETLELADATKSIEIADLQLTTSNNATAITKAKTDISTNASAIGSLASDVTNQRNQILAIQNDMATTNQQISAMDTQITTINNSIAALELTSSQHTTDITMVQGDISQIKIDIEELKTLMAISQAEYQELQNRVTTIENDNTQIHQTLDTMNQTLTSIQNTLASLDTRLDRLETNQLNIAVSNISFADADEDTITTGIQVSNNLTLPLTDSNGAEISWVSSNESLITSTGLVTQPSYTVGDQQVTLTATTVYGEQTKIKNFVITVLHAVADDSERVSEDIAALNIDSFDEDNVTAGIQVVNNKAMQTVGSIHGTAITWVSSDPAHFAIDGTVTRPAYNSTNAIVTLTATVTSGLIAQTKDFTLTVIKAEPTASEMVLEDKAVLNLDAADEDTLTAGIQVTQDIALPIIGELYGSTIEWASSNPIYINSAGTVVQPTYTDGDQNITMTATITNDTASDTKSFVITVLALPISDQEKVDADANVLSIDSFDEDALTDGIQVTTNKVMPLLGDIHSSTIVWASDDEIHFTTDGIVTQPTVGEPNAEIILTATITNGTGSTTKSFNVTVLALV